MRLLLSNRRFDPGLARPSMSLSHVVVWDVGGSRERTVSEINPHPLDDPPRLVRDEPEAASIYIIVIARDGTAARFEFRVPGCPDSHERWRRDRRKRSKVLCD
jgi:hypothetical protein